jgi:molybdopterin synthase sulfur carrier subunit
VRFFACREDLSHQPMTAPLPPEVVAGREVLIVLGAMAGG